MILNELSQTLDELVECGERLIKIAENIRGLYSTKAPPTEVEPAKVYEFTEVRQAFAKKSHEGHSAEIRELLKRYGADRLSEVKQEDYGKIMTELEAIE